MPSPESAAPAEEPARRARILDAAVQAFTRYGYRKTSMDDVARSAAISRPGLYLHFPSKEALFRAAITRALQLDLAAAQQALDERDHPLRRRLTAAFDAWAGRWAGSVGHDLAGLVDAHPDLLGPEVDIVPRRFAAAIEEALTASGGPRRTALDAAATLLAASAGIKADSAGREEYVARLDRTVALVLLALDHASNGAGPE